MRDPARIARILSKLARVWEAAPDLRLGQLCDCVVSRHTQYSELTFELEDDLFEEALDKWLANPAGYVHSKIRVDKPTQSA